MVATNGQGDDDRRRRRPSTRAAGQQPRPPVMADVAALAGVSQMTVSRVINDYQRVRAETRDRVVAAMEQLGYRPNVAARALATGRSRALGVLIYDMEDYGPASTLARISEAASAAGYAISIAPMRSSPPQSLADAVGRLMMQGVDGLVAILPNRRAVEDLHTLSVAVPIIAIMGAPGAGECSSVGVDQAGGAARAVRYLLSLGHETVWHVAGPSVSIDAAERERAWRETLVAAGRVVPPLLRGDWSSRSGFEQGQVLAATEELAAVFVANDQMALGVMRALREAGRDVPGDVSVVGFDDLPEAAYFTPSLTTVRQEFGEVGRRSMELLLQSLDGADPHPGAHLAIEPELVVRDSSGPASQPPHP